MWNHLQTTTTPKSKKLKVLITIMLSLYVRCFLFHNNNIHTNQNLLFYWWNKNLIKMLVLPLLVKKMKFKEISNNFERSECSILLPTSNILLYTYTVRYNQLPTIKTILITKMPEFFSSLIRFIETSNRANFFFRQKRFIIFPILSIIKTICRCIISIQSFIGHL